MSPDRVKVPACVLIMAVLVTWPCGLYARSPSGPPAGVAAAGEDHRVALTRAAGELRKSLGPRFVVDVEGPFVVAGDLPPEPFERFCRGTIRWAYDHLVGEFFTHVPFTRTITIYLFRDDGSYRHHAKKLFGDDPSTPFGYFSNRHSALVMNIATGGGTLVHEMVHPLLENDFPGVPAWFSEGLASLFEQCAERDGRIIGLTNWRLSGLKRAIGSGELTGLDALLETSSGTFYGARSGLNYAQARYLLYWLQERTMLGAFYDRFRTARGDDPTGRRTLEAIIGRPLVDFEPSWREFVMGLRFNGE